jgi:hypothetical protein
VFVLCWKKEKESKLTMRFCVDDRCSLGNFCWSFEKVPSGETLSGKQYEEEEEKSKEIEICWKENR